VERERGRPPACPPQSQSGGGGCGGTSPIAARAPRAVPRRNLPDFCRWVGSAAEKWDVCDEPAPGAGAEPVPGLLPASDELRAAPRGRWPCQTPRWNSVSFEIIPFLTKLAHKTPVVAVPRAAAGPRQPAGDGNLTGDAVPRAMGTGRPLSSRLRHSLSKAKPSAAWRWWQAGAQRAMPGRAMPCRAVPGCAMPGCAMPGHAVPALSCWAHVHSGLGSQKKWQLIPPAWKTVPSVACVGNLTHLQSSHGPRLRGESRCVSPESLPDWHRSCAVPLPPDEGRGSLRCGCWWCWAWPNARRSLRWRSGMAVPAHPSPSQSVPAEQQTGTFIHPPPPHCGLCLQHTQCVNAGDVRCKSNAGASSLRVWAPSGTERAPRSQRLPVERAR